MNQESFFLTTPSTTTEVPRYDIMWSPTGPAAFFMKPLSSITKSDWPRSWSRRPLTTASVAVLTTPTPTQTPTTTTPVPSTTTEEIDSDSETELPEADQRMDAEQSDAKSEPADFDTKNSKIERASHGRSRSFAKENIIKGRNIRRRSNHHLAICRREFLRPLEAREAASDLVFTGIVERVHKRVNSPFDRSRRHHPVGEENAENRQRHHHKSGQNWYRGIVRVKRVIKGDKELEGARLMIEGFGSRKICESNAKSGDSRIFMVNSTKNGRYKINSSLMRIDFDNLKKVISAAKSKTNF